MSKELIQGVTTIEKHYTYDFKDSKWRVYYQGKEESSWDRTHPSDIQLIVNSLNEAYIRGFEASSLILMNKTEVEVLDENVEPPKFDQVNEGFCEKGDESEIN